MISFSKLSIIFCAVGGVGCDAGKGKNASFLAHKKKIVKAMTLSAFAAAQSHALPENAGSTEAVSDVLKTAVPDKGQRMLSKDDKTDKVLKAKMIIGDLRSRVGSARAEATQLSGTTELSQCAESMEKGADGNRRSCSCTDRQNGCVKESWNIGPTLTCSNKDYVMYGAYVPIPGSVSKIGRWRGTYVMYKHLLSAPFKCSGTEHPDPAPGTPKICYCVSKEQLTAEITANFAESTAEITGGGWCPTQQMWDGTKCVTAVAATCRKWCTPENGPQEKFELGGMCMDGWQKKME